MNLYKYEIKKLLSLPSIWVFVITAALANLLYSATVAESKMNFVRAVKAGEYNVFVHACLFGEYAKLLLIESVIISIILAFYVTHFEGISKTTQNIFSTKTGRKLMVQKCLAAFTAGSVMFVLIYVSGFAIMRGFNNVTPLLTATISGFSNTDIRHFKFLEQAFLPWQNMTVTQYLIFTIVVSFAINTVCVALSLPKRFNKRDL